MKHYSFTRLSTIQQRIQFFNTIKKYGFEIPTPKNGMLGKWYRLKDLKILLENHKKAREKIVKSYYETTNDIELAKRLKELIEAIENNENLERFGGIKICKEFKDDTRS